MCGWVLGVDPGRPLAAPTTSGRPGSCRSASRADVRAVLLTRCRSLRGDHRPGRLATAPAASPHPHAHRPSTPALTDQGRFHGFDLLTCRSAALVIESWRQSGALAPTCCQDCAPLDVDSRAGGRNVRVAVVLPRQGQRSWREVGARAPLQSHEMCRTLCPGTSVTWSSAGGPV